MILNYDCMRDALIYLENNLNYLQGTENLNKTGTASVNWKQAFTDETLTMLYSEQDIQTAIAKLVQDEAITADVVQQDGVLLECQITDISEDGHDLVNQIRSDKVWEQTKESLQPDQDCTLQELADIAYAIITKMLSKKNL